MITSPVNIIDPVSDNEEEMPYISPVKSPQQSPIVIDDYDSEVEMASPTRRNPFGSSSSMDSTYETPKGSSRPPTAQNSPVEIEMLSPVIQPQVVTTKNTTPQQSDTETPRVVKSAIAGGSRREMSAKSTARTPTAKRKIVLDQDDNPVDFDSNKTKAPPRRKARTETEDSESAQTDSENVHVLVEPKPSTSTKSPITKPTGISIDVLSDPEAAWPEPVAGPSGSNTESEVETDIVTVFDPKDSLIKRPKAVKKKDDNKPEASRKSSRESKIPKRLGVASPKAKSKKKRSRSRSQSPAAKKAATPQAIKQAKQAAKEVLDKLVPKTKPVLAQKKYKVLTPKEIQAKKDNWLSEYSAKQKAKAEAAKKKAKEDSPNFSGLIYEELVNRSEPFELHDVEFSLEDDPDT